MKRLFAGALAAGIMTFAMSASASAAVIFNSSNGWSSASVSQSGTTLTFELTNSIANPIASQMLSGFELFFGVAPTSVTSLTQSGQLVTISPTDGSYSNTLGSPTHWGVGLSGDTFYLETVGPYAVGGQPFDLITSGTSDSNHNPGVTNFNPHILGTGTFTVQLPDGYDALSQITGAGFQWSTSAGFIPGVPGGVPEPATWAMMIIGFGMVGFTLRRRRLGGLVQA